MVPLRLRLALSRGAAPLRWAGVTAALLVAGIFAAPLKTEWPGDFYGFWIVGQTARSSFVTSIYDRAGQIGVADAARAGAETAPTELEKRMRRFHSMMDLTASPFHYAAFSAVSSGDLVRDYDRFRWLSVFLYATGVLALWAVLGFPAWTAPLVVWFFTIPFWPYRRDVLDANDSAALAGAVMLAFLPLASSRAGARAAAGAALGLLTAFKPTVMYAPALAAVFFAAASPRALVPFIAGVAGGLAAAVAASAMLLGSSVSWSGWSAAVPHRAFEMRDIAGGLLGRVFHVESELWYHALTALLLGGAALWIWTAVRATARRSLLEQAARPRGLDVLAAAAAGLNIYLLCGMLVWGHYFTLTVPSALIALRPRPHRADGGRTAQLLGAFACALIAFHPLYRRLGLTTMGNYSLFTLAGTAILLLISLWDLRDHRSSFLGAGQPRRDQA